MIDRYEADYIAFCRKRCDCTPARGDLLVVHAGQVARILSKPQSGVGNQHNHAFLQSTGRHALAPAVAGVSDTDVLARNSHHKSFSVNALEWCGHITYITYGHLSQWQVY